MYNAINKCFAGKVSVPRKTLLLQTGLSHLKLPCSLPRVTKANFLW